MLCTDNEKYREVRRHLERREPMATFRAVTYLLAFNIIPEKEVRSPTNPMVKYKSVYALLFQSWCVNFTICVRSHTLLHGSLNKT